MSTQTDFNRRLAEIISQARNAFALVIAEEVAHMAKKEGLPDVHLLTPRQEQVLRLVLRGHRNKEIANILHIGERTVKYHVTDVLKAFGVANRVELLAKQCD
jgi:DNA-binding NarL/FixJ family response regulator